MDSGSKWFWIGLFTFLSIMAIAGLIDREHRHAETMKRLEKLPDAQVQVIDGKRYIYWRLGK
jgi:hypothetical protein